MTDGMFHSKLLGRRKIEESKKKRINLFNISKLKTKKVFFFNILLRYIYNQIVYYVNNAIHSIVNQSTEYMYMNVYNVLLYY